MVKNIAGDKLTIVNLKALSTEQFWNWSKSYRLDKNGDVYLGLEKFDFNNELWFELVKAMWRKHHRVF